MFWRGPVLCITTDFLSWLRRGFEYLRHLTTKTVATTISLDAIVTWCTGGPTSNIAPHFIIWTLEAT
jgi:hypothetical protein